MKFKNIILLSILTLEAMASTIDLSSRPEYQWRKVLKGAEVNSFPVTGMVIAEEGALHFQTARISGRVLSLESAEGSRVKKGAPLFSVTGPECVSIREEKKIAMKSHLSDLIEPVEQRTRELNIRVSDKSCVMVADADGILVKRAANSGSAFNQGDVLAHILEVSKMIIEIEVPEKSASLITKGTVVNFKIPSLNDFKDKSTVQQVFPLVEEGSRIMKARLQKIKLPGETKLNSMVFADVALANGKTCLKVPTNAVTLQDGNSWVLLKREKDVKRVPVHVISTQEDSMLINALKEGDLLENDVVATFNVPFLYKEMKKREDKGDE